MTKPNKGNPNNNDNMWNEELRETLKDTVSNSDNGKWTRKQEEEYLRERLATERTWKNYDDEGDDGEDYD